MNRWTIALLTAALAGAAAWWASRPDAQVAEAWAQPSGSTSIDPGMVRTLPNVDPRMARTLPNVDPRMARDPSTPRK